MAKFGRREWVKKESSNIRAVRSYEWVDRVIFLDESNGQRLYTGETTFTSFQKELDDWKEVETLE